LCRITGIRTSSLARRKFLQGRLRDYSVADPAKLGKLAPPPSAHLLQTSDDDSIHQIEPSVVPTTGLRLDRRYVLVRQTDGLPVLWVQRQRLPLFSPPVSRLQFDVLKPVQASG
jgi:hypothetical protein